MKKFVHYLWVLFAIAGLCTACSTDDIEPSTDNSELWQGNLAAAPYANDAVCLEPHDASINGKTVNTIELTASGLYYITYAGSQTYYRPASFRKIAPATRDWTPEQSIVTGEFTPLGKNKYNLKNFGEMTINPDGTVRIELEDGQEYIWPVTSVPKIDNISQNTRLCRTWQLVSAHIDFLNSDMKVIYSLNVPEGGMEQANYIYAVTFTSAERVYRQDEPNDYWYGGNWYWADLSAQLVYLESDDPSDGEGIFQVLFKDNKMEIMNPWDFNEFFESLDYFLDIPGAENIPAESRYAREYINLKAMN